MSKLTMTTGREVVNPLASVSTELESTSSMGGTSRTHRVVNNDQYGDCPKCNEAMPITKNAQGVSVFYCGSCRVAAPCKA